MKKKILMIIGHPYKNSFCHALAENYLKGAKNTGAEVNCIDLAEIQFDPILRFGYNKRMTWEPDLVEAWQKIEWSDHLVFVFPLWWGTMPAILKGFFDRVFLPGKAFSYRKDSVWWDKHLKGKSARVIVTMDQPALYHYLINWAPGFRSIKKMILNFCGVSPVKFTSIGPIRNSTDIFRNKKLETIYNLGQKQK
jgi:putative NADPH-quinone reductase